MNRLVATFRPQADQRGYCVDIDGSCQFDATLPFLNLDLERIQKFTEHSEDSDRLAIDIELPEYEEHNGPFEVDVDIDEWLEANGVPEGRYGITQEHLNRLRKQHAIRFAVVEDIKRYFKMKTEPTWLPGNIYKVWCGDVELWPDVQWVYYKQFKRKTGEDPTMPDGWYELQPYWFKPPETPSMTTVQDSTLLTMTDEEREEYHGLYWEEVGKLVDGIEAEIMDGFLTNKEQAMMQLEDCAAESGWATDDPWCLCTLWFSNNACACFVSGNLPKAIKDERAAQPRYWGEGDSLFNWFATSAIKLDCAQELMKREKYQALPDDPAAAEIKERLEYLRGEIEAERISYEEIAELQSLVEHIPEDDVLLLEWAGKKEFPDEVD